MYNLTYNTPYDQHIKKRVMNAHLRQHHLKGIINSHPEPTVFSNVRLIDGKPLEKMPRRNF